MFLHQLRQISSGFLLELNRRVNSLVCIEGRWYGKIPWLLGCECEDTITRAIRLLRGTVVSGKRMVLTRVAAVLRKGFWDEATTLDTSDLSRGGFPD
jgi:hypothetical protein